ncbi:hypothetical protein PUNSTDRAFT_138201 [Punctularia strigosozonata HHB-11173 SS5]|uniref:Hydrophobin n=1 Tax=Punctularia strigosozonata (strain HHB-11173) TaxID=741275 RepID=R7S567_PUNST|nr:uncharacterized protein PUNSTDRAFT_138201 [Punctularia strigosozonata HHB-11173 SS5]EIN05017.1 hypothetical protein PUNSTDRAFT_138201 [Punctularia strigosozonata HHB-11173 SS5]
MLFKLSSVLVIATSSLAIGAAASPANLSKRQDALCASDTTAQCCSSAVSSDDDIIATILGLLEIVTSTVIPIGLSCTPVVDEIDCAADLLCCSSTADGGGLLGGLGLLDPITDTLGIDCLPLVGSLPVVGGL